MMIKAKCNGFTIVEVVVVVVIAAIMVTVTIPKLIESTEKAYISDAVSNMRTLFGAEQRLILEKGAGSADCAALGVTIVSSNKYYPPTCLVDGTIYFTRTGVSSGSGYTLKMLPNGTITCTGKCSSVSGVVKLGGLSQGG